VVCCAPFIFLKLTSVSLDTDTTRGSIRVPAAACGVYGFKPTAFRIPANGWNCVAPSADTIPTVIGPISVSLGGIDMFMSTVLAARPWIKDPSLSSMSWQSTSVNPTVEEPLCIGVLWHDDEVLPHPPITRAIEELISRVRADSDLSKRVKFYDFPAHRHSYGWELLSRLYFSDGGASDRAAAAESGEPLCPLLEWLIDERGVKRLTRSQFELALEDREAFCEEYAHHWNAVGSEEKEGSKQHEVTLSKFRPYSCKVNVLICPVAPYIASPHGKAKYWSYTSLWNLLDYPALSLPTPTVVNETEDQKPDRKDFMSSIDEKMWSWCR
jgi:amidase